MPDENGNPTPAEVDQAIAEMREALANLEAELQALIAAAQLDALRRRDLKNLAEIIRIGAQHMINMARFW